MNPPNLSPVLDLSLSELGELPARSLVALAARAARRALPLLQLPADSDEVIRKFVRAIWLAEDFAAGKPFEAPESIEPFVDDLYQTASTVSDASGYGGYAAAHAVRAAQMGSLFQSNGDLENYTETIASTFAAALVLKMHCGMFAEEQVRSAIRADYEALKKSRETDPISVGNPVDPRESGPLGTLWPNGVPDWYS